MTKRAYLYFFLTFIIGVAVGGWGVYYCAWRAGVWHRPWNENEAVHKLTQRLDLQPDQVKELRSILDDTVKKWREIQAQTKPQLEALHKQTDQRIRQMLNPEQQKRFDSLVRAHEKRAKH